MSFFNKKKYDDEEQVYLPVKSISTQLPDQTLSEDVEDKLRAKNYKSRFHEASKVIVPLRVIAFILIFISLSYLIITQLRYIFFSTSYFELKEFQVTGNSTLSQDYIIKKSGIAPAQHIFSLDCEEVKQRLLNEPLIKDASVELQGLNTLKINITERHPFIYAKCGIAFYEVSEDGVIINTEGMGEKDLPIITGLKLEESTLGTSIAHNDDFYMAKSWVKTFDENILKQISEINFSKCQNPYIIMLTGEKIFPRNAEDFKNRYVFLRALLDNLRKNNVEPFYLDMRALNDIVIRPQKISQTNSENRGLTTGG
ncbi:MAG: FtsQ-type POTRA domain-containing protein [Candidatus Riflebacteria bacterium]|jgi:cell division protein FtsQ|nr:FtsQ-type POTRA domain-containing protein [Candidatus Riflebacteria bacterium]